MARTTPKAVQDLLGPNWDGAACLDPFIATAGEMTTDVYDCARGKGTTYTATRLELMERWLAAYYYTLQDPLYQSRSTLSASGAFVAEKDGTNRYLKGALDLDKTGCLSALTGTGPKRAGGIWLGLGTAAEPTSPDNW